MIQIQHKQDCCGCSACAQVCPKHCIAMVEDPEGFLYPSVDSTACIHCNLCDASCPILTGGTSETPVIRTFAAYAKDHEIRLASSSGGIFTLLAQWVLEQKGVVFGAAFSEDFSVHHIPVDRMEDLHLLQGSKYVQSRIEDTYIQAKELLEAGRIVLFSGVGCQIAGLKSCLKKNYPNLYTVNVLCHGVPSPKVWNRYLREQQADRGSKAAGVSFRDKSRGWKDYSLSIRFQDGQIQSKSRNEDVFLEFFQENICLRPSCHDCRFKTLPHPADLTLGDAWGIEARMPELSDDQGTSLILVNTEAGQQLFDAISGQMVFQAGETDTLLPPSADSRTSVTPHTRRAPFFSALARGASVSRLRKILRGNFLWKILSLGKRVIRTVLRKFR